MSASAQIQKAITELSPSALDKLQIGETRQLAKRILGDTTKNRDGKTKQTMEEFVTKEQRAFEAMQSQYQNLVDTTGGKTKIVKV